MKNNIVTQSQFYFSAFLSTFVALLFIDVRTSYQQIICLAVAFLLNLFVIVCYKGKSNIFIKTILFIYYIMFSIAVMIELVIFMNSAIKSGSYWVLVLIITATVLFTCTKGFEALSRGAVIITFFSVLFILYIFASTVSDIQLYEFSFNNSAGILPALILLFPSALYASLGNNLKNGKKYPLIIQSFSSFFVTGYMILLASPENSPFPLHQIMKNSTLGIFKGSDFLLLSLITIGTIYFVSLSICGVVSDAKSKAPYVITLLVISSLSMLCLYIRNLRSFFISEKVLFSVSLLMILALIVNSMYESIVSQHKICNKSKKN